MNAGIIKKNKFSVVDAQGNSQTKEYLEMILDFPFIGRETYTISANKKKDSDNKPDFYIYRSMNRKGEKYRSQRLGALWNKLSDSGIPYKNGYIESPVFFGGKINISVFETKPMENENQEQITWSHDVLWSPPREDKNENIIQQAQTQHTIAEIDIPDDEIPF